MNAKEFTDSEGYTKDDGYGWIITQSELIDLLKSFSEHQNKELIEEKLRREKNIQRFWDVSDHDFEVIATRSGTFETGQEIRN